MNMGITIIIISVVLFVYVFLKEKAMQHEITDLKLFVKQARKNDRSEMIRERSILEDKYARLYNENPYSPNTSVTIFTRDMDADEWKMRNCDRCKLMGTCKAIAFMSKSEDMYDWDIPLMYAKEIGITYDALDRIGDLYSPCLMLEREEGEPEDELNF